MKCKYCEAESREYINTRFTVTCGAKACMKLLKKEYHKRTRPGTSKIGPCAVCQTPTQLHARKQTCGKACQDKLKRSKRCNPSVKCRFCDGMTIPKHATCGAEVCKAMQRDYANMLRGGVKRLQPVLKAKPLPPPPPARKADPDALWNSLEARRTRTKDPWRERVDEIKAGLPVIERFL